MEEVSSKNNSIHEKIGLNLDSSQLRPSLIFPNEIFIVYLFSTASYVNLFLGSDRVHQRFVINSFDFLRWSRWLNMKFLWWRSTMPLSCVANWSGSDRKGWWILAWILVPRLWICFFCVVTATDSKSQWSKSTVFLFSVQKNFSLGDIDSCQKDTKKKGKFLKNNQRWGRRGSKDFLQVMYFVFPSLEFEVYLKVMQWKFTKSSYFFFTCSINEDQTMNENCLKYWLMRVTHEKGCIKTRRYSPFFYSHQWNQICRSYSIKELVPWTFPLWSICSKWNRGEENTTHSMKFFSCPECWIAILFLSNFAWINDNDPLIILLLLLFLELCSE